MSIAALLQAAEYIERREREAEHGYASTMPVPNDLSRKRPKSKKTQGSRYQEVLMTLARKQKTTHNELEKNRRAHLRNCLEKLKDIVPLGPESSRHTTLGLLTKAKGFIKTLEDRDRRQQQQKDQLLREQRYLRRRLDQLEVQYGGSGHKRRSLSECSSSTSLSTNSCTSETDEVDIMGYNSNQSDTDDHSSIQSLNSDGGVAISTKRLTLLEAVSI